MKKYLLVISLFGFLFGQDKYKFFLESDENLKLVGENYDIIKAELDKMLIDYNSKINLDNYWKEKYTEKVYLGSTTDDVAVANAMLSIRNPTQTDYDLARAYATKDNYDYVQKEKNRIIEPTELKFGADIFNKEKGRDYTAKEIQEAIIKTENVIDLYSESMAAEVEERLVKMRKIHSILSSKGYSQKKYLGTIISTIKAEWKDVVSYYGGYAELSKIGISKDNKSKFDLDITLEKIELTGTSKCLAHVKINGKEDALKFHNIPKSTYKYKGSYNIDYDKDYLALYDDGLIWINLKFDEKKYLHPFEENIFLNESLLPSVTDYRNAIELMLDDLLPDNDGGLNLAKVNEQSPEMGEEDACSEYYELLDTRFRGKVRKYRKAKKEELNKRKMNIGMLYEYGNYNFSFEEAEDELEPLYSMMETPEKGFPILSLIRSCGFDPSEKCN